MSKLNKWSIKKIICYNEDKDEENTQLCGVGNGFGCGDGCGEENGEIFSYESDQCVDYFWGRLGSGNGTINGSGNGDGHGDCYSFESGFGLE